MRNNKAIRSTETVDLGAVISINPDSVGKDFRFETIKYIDITSVGSGTLNGFSEIKFSKAPSRAKRLVRSADTILSTVRPNRRSFLYVKNPKPNIVVSTGFAVLRATDKIDSRYLYYTVTHQPFTDYLTNNAKGAAYPAVDTETIARAEIWLPPLPTQRKIAAILSAYDDLIENNLRRIRILEEMAQLIYREWFVNFRFPGHEKVRMVESDLGKIPEGWQTKNLFAVAEVTYGFPFQSKLFTQEPAGMAVIRIRDIASNETKTFTTETAREKYLVENGDILVGMDGDFRMTKWAGGKAYLNQRVVRFRPEGGVASYYLFLALQKPIAYFNSTTVGTTVAHLSDEDLRSIYLLVPDEDTARKSWPIFGSVFSLEIALRLQIANLRRTRDLLLPKLISGELDVSELDIDIGEEPA